MTIEISAWLLWTLGIGLGVPAAAFTVILAMIGYAFMRGM